MNDTARELDVALQLADVADQISMRWFRSPELRPERKADGSPVTVGDREIETAIRSELSRVFPSDEILGEEFGGTRDARRVWMIDPIDGTASFAAGDTDWATLISLVEDGVPVVGVVSRPAVSRRWWAARGQGACADGWPIAVSRTTRLSEATIAEDFRVSIGRGLTWNPLARLAAQCAAVAPWVDPFNFLAVAEGTSDFLVNWWGGTGPDLTSSICIVTEAGGKFSDLHGTLDIDAGVQLISNGALHEPLLVTCVRGSLDIS